MAPDYTKDFKKAMMRRNVGRCQRLPKMFLKRFLKKIPYVQWIKIPSDLSSS